MNIRENWLNYKFHFQNIKIKGADLKTVLLAILILFELVSCSKHDNNKVSINSYDIKVDYDTLSRFLYVKANIQINLLEHNNDKIKLLFNDSSKIGKIQFIEKNFKYTVSYSFWKDTITMKLPEQLQNHKQLLLYLEYCLPIDSIAISKIFSVFRSFKWCPLLYDNLSKWRIKIKTPLNYEAFSSGVLSVFSTDESHSYYTWEYNNMSGVPLIITPKNLYSLTKKFIDNKELDFYFLIKDTIRINKMINEFCKSFHYYNSKYGEYKNKNFRIFEYPDSSDGGDFAMCLETSVVIGTKMIRNIDKPYVGLFWIAHETGHQWIGIGYHNSFNNRLSWFIEEGLTEYIRYLYIEDEYGKDSLKSVFQQYKTEFETQYLNTEDDVPISSNKPDRITYIKSPIIFNYVEQEIGKENFINFIRTLYQKYYGKVIDYDIFKSELSKFDKSGKVIKRMEEMTEIKGLLPVQ